MSTPRAEFGGGLCECGCGKPAPIAPQTLPRRGYIKGEPTRFIKGHHGRGKGRDLRERFMENASPEPMSGCWLWVGAAFNTGYGQLRVGAKTISAHRLAWELFRGLIPDGLSVLHRCDVPACVNPDHLFIGTHNDNNQDRHMKGRDARGGTHWCSKFTEDQVRQIRAQATSDERRSYPAIAKLFGVTRATIRRIVVRETWKHI
jgi:HNH endonuclease